jgi:hypothetical protein
MGVLSGAARCERPRGLRRHHDVCAGTENGSSDQT